MHVDQHPNGKEILVASNIRKTEMILHLINGIKNSFVICKISQILILILIN